MPGWAWLVAIIAAFGTVNRAYLMVLLIRRRVDEAEGMRLVADFERKLPRSSKLVTDLIRVLLDWLRRGK